VTDASIFVVQLDVPRELDDDFNRVYDNDHLVHMMQIPGVRSCRRYRLEWSDNADMQRYLAIYELDDPHAPQSATWQEHGGRGRWPIDIRPHTTMRRNGVYRPISHAVAKQAAGDVSSVLGDSIYFLLQSVPAALEAKFNELYDGDHIPLMLQAPGVRACTRFRLAWTASGDIPEYLAIYAISGPEVPRSPAWKQQTSKGAWPTEMRPHFTARRNGAFSLTLHRTR